MATALINKFSSPSANTDTPVYTVAASTSTVLSTGLVCNKNATAITFRIWIKSLGATDYYLYYDVTVAGNDTFAFTIGQVLVATDVLYVRASSTNVNFTFSGEENT